MARSNPVIEGLQRTVRMLRDQIERMRRDQFDIPLLACDHSCVVATATGMAPNGGCRCDEQKLRRAVMYWRAVAQQRQAIIQSHVDGTLREVGRIEGIEQCAQVVEQAPLSLANLANHFRTVLKESDSR